jgi:hypothetical protein
VNAAPHDPPRNASRGAAGIAIAFALASVPACITMVPTQAMTGQENALGLVAFFGISWTLLFALGSFVGLRVAGITGKQLHAGTRGCAAGGAASGLLFACLLLRLRDSTNVGSPLLTLIVVASPLLFPWMIGWVTVKVVR